MIRRVTTISAISAMLVLMVSRATFPVWSGCALMILGVWCLDRNLIRYKASDRRLFGKMAASLLFAGMTLGIASSSLQSLNIFSVDMTSVNPITALQSLFVYACAGVGVPVIVWVMANKIPKPIKRTCFSNRKSRTNWSFDCLSSDTASSLTEKKRAC